MSHKAATRIPAQGRAPVEPVLDSTAARAAPGTEVRRIQAEPLTERILGWLPGPRAVWVCVWAAVPWLNLAILTTWAADWTWGDIPLSEALNRAAVTFAILLSLWGAARIATELRRLQDDLVQVVEQEQPDVERLFGGVDNVVAPLLLTVAVGLVLPLDELLRGETTGGLVQLFTWLVIGLPLGTALWVYLVLQVGLTRLGRGHLTLQGYRGDRSLGLQPVGRLAFTAFWMLFGAIAPLVLTGFSDPPVVAVGCTVLLAGLAMFFVSLQGLHRQMEAVRKHELDRALTLYQGAYEQVQQTPTMEVLQQQSGMLNAAESLEKRAERIQSWPFDEATFARVVTIATSVAAVIIARLILAPTGL